MENKVTISLEIYDQLKEYEKAFKGSGVMSLDWRGNHYISIDNNDLAEYLDSQFDLLNTENLKISLLKSQIELEVEELISKTSFWKFIKIKFESLYR